MNIQTDILLAPYTSWLIGGAAEYFASPESLEELCELQAWALDRKVAVTLLGGGSNVLVSDQGVAGLVICLKNFSGVVASKEIRTWRHQKSLGPQELFCLEALAGTRKSDLLKAYLKEKLAPALFLAGLPGDLGGGLAMNAGVAENSSPREFTELVEWVEVLRPDGTIERKDHDDLIWSYRHLDGWQPGILIKALLTWPCRPDDSILDQVRIANRNRLAKQPLDLPSCGSVFVNPTGYKAAQLIDSCGLKGYTVGAAQVSMKHANFIVNLGGAQALQVLQVIEHVQRVVLQKTGVNLVTEVVRMGRWD